MTLKKRAIKSYRSLNVPMSFKLMDQNKLSYAQNIINNDDVQETRYGLKRFNSTSLGGPAISQSFFKKANGTAYRLAKVGTTLYSVQSTGAHTAIKTGLTSTTRHRAVTFIDRHIVAIEGDGLFFFDGTNFSELGQAAPAAPTATMAAGGNLVDGTDYRAAITYYSSTTGFESNYTETATVTGTAVNKTIALTSIPSTATNPSIDTIRIYIKDMDAPTAFLFVDDIALGTTTYNITAMSTSTITPPTTNFPPQAGGAKYLTIFGDKIAYSGNSNFPTEVFFSKSYQADAYDNQDVPGILLASGQGPITGLASGFFDDTKLEPYLVVFKRNAITIYSELGGVPAQALIDENVGCVSADTIRLGNGLIYFMSDHGWRVIKKGTLVKKSEKGIEIPYTLGSGDIDDIFTRAGADFELNSDRFSFFFGAYYTISSAYITFVNEGRSEDFLKAYVYEEKVGGFRAFTFKYKIVSACDSEDEDGNQCILLSDETGYLFTYSIKNPRYDEDISLNQLSIPAKVSLSYIQPDDMTTSYNFKTLTLKALTSETPITVTAFPGYDTGNFEQGSFDFTNPGSTFILDVSQLDIDKLGDDRTLVTVKGDLSLTGETLLLVLEKDVVGSNIGLIAAQVELNKNGELIA